MPTDVSFDEEDQVAPQRVISHPDSAITKMVISLGLAKSRKDAEYVMLGFVVVLIILAVVIFYFSTPHNPSPTINPQSAAFQAEFDTPHPASQP